MWRNLRYSFFYFILMSAFSSAAAASLDQITLLYPPNADEAVLLFEGTSLSMPEDHVTKARRDKKYRTSQEYKAAQNILSALSAEYKYSDRDGALKGAARQRQRTLTLLSENLSPADQETFTRNFIRVREDQENWKRLIDRIRDNWITEPIPETLEPSLNKGVKGGSTQYLSFINNWAEDYQKAGGSADGQLALMWDAQVRRVFRRGPGAQRFLENLMDLVQEGKIEAVPASVKGRR